MIFYTKTATGNFFTFHIKVSFQPIITIKAKWMYINQRSAWECAAFLAVTYECLLNMNDELIHERYCSLCVIHEVFLGEPKSKGACELTHQCIGGLLIVIPIHWYHGFMKRIQNTHDMHKWRAHSCRSQA